MENPSNEQRKKIFKRPEVIKVSYSFAFLPVVFILGLISGWLIWGRDAAQTPQGNSLEAQQPGEVVKREISLDDDPWTGTDNAPITIVEFSDFQCPFCVKWHQEVFSTLMKEYEGKIKFVYRDFPLYSIHPEAEPAAIAANCAGQQNAYWQFHELLFSGGKDLGRETYLAYGQQVGVSADQFIKCLDDEKNKDEITADYEYASSQGVSSTPTFFINGIAVVGAQPVEVFRQVIESELVGKK
jgi:protein-disulfide isomerase